MNDILKEFYRGNLSPADRQLVKGSEMARAVDELSKAETVLEQSLPPELRPALKRLADAQLALNDLTAEAYYVDGFRIGARFMLATIIVWPFSQSLNRCIFTSVIGRAYHRPNSQRAMVFLSRPSVTVNSVSSLN